MYYVPLRDNLPQRGPDDALVTIVESADFQCPYSARAVATINQILETYGDDVRVVWLNNPLPFRRDAPTAHAAAMEAFEQRGNRAFWRMHDLLFRNQENLSRPRLERWARSLGLGMARFRRALDNDEHARTFRSQQSLLRPLLGGSVGTPNFFINGRNVRGARCFAMFERVINEELARARELIANGTPRSGVYAAAIADGITEPRNLTE